MEGLCKRSPTPLHGGMMEWGRGYVRLVEYCSRAINIRQSLMRRACVSIPERSGFESGEEHYEVARITCGSCAAVLQVLMRIAFQSLKT